MGFLSSSLFWLFFALTGIFMVVFEFGYSSRGIFRATLCQFFLAIGGFLLTVNLILSFVFMWWQGGIAILISYFIFMVVIAIIANIIRKRFLQSVLKQ
jgi:hypothetical protein